MAHYICLLLTAVVLYFAAPAWGDPFNFVTGPPDGRLAAASRIPGGGLIEIEAGDDFITTADQTIITGASFFGLLPGGTLISSITQVDVELYRIFPLDSVNPPDGRVPTRTNSPADVAFDTRSSATAQLTFTVTPLGSFTATNSVLNGINPIPNQTTGGEGSVTGTQVRIDVTFTVPFQLFPGHYFVVPQVRLSNGSTFFWLSTAGPPLFVGDLQAWIRNANLDPDWLRIGTDIIGGTTFDMAFSLTGVTAGLPALQANVPGSLLVFPLFDCTTGHDTKIRITNGGVLPVNVRLTFVCAPATQPTTGTAFCNMSDESFPFTPHQTRVFDVCAEIGGATATCPTGQGYVIAFAERRCDPTGTGCTSQNGTPIAAGEVAPISWNALIGSYFVYSAALDVGPEPDVEGAQAIAIQSPQAALTFLGTDAGPGSALTLTFGPPTFDYVALPRTLNTDFAAVGGVLGVGPATPPPGPAADIITGTELATNFILLNLNAVLESANALTRVAINVWNWFEVPFTVSNQFVCWERIPGFLPVGSPPVPFIDPHFGVALLGSDYGNARFTPIATAGVTPALLGAVEEISTFGRTIRNMFHTGASAATLVTDVEGP